MSNSSSSLEYLDSLDASVDRSEASRFNQLCRSNQHVGHTSGQVPGFIQVNTCILPQKYAYDFLLFCQRNPKPFPLLEVTDVGSYRPKIITDCDLRTDIPRYSVYGDGKMLADKVTDVIDHWRDDLVTFLFGCSFSFEHVLVSNGFKIRHLEEGKAVPVYITTIPCRPAGVFSGPIAVTMRPFKKSLIPEIIKVTSQFPRIHSTPVHYGNPEDIGIKDINKPDWGEPVTIHEDEEPVFWACGSTTETTLAHSDVDFAIFQHESEMLVTRKKIEEENVANPQVCRQYRLD